VNADPNKTSLLRAAFQKKLELHSTRGDFDGDGDVDASDYGVWQATFGAANLSKADANRDGRVDMADYVLWQKFASAAGASGGAVDSVPDISSPWLLLLGGTAIRKRRSACRRRLASAK
jgi:hypothetical protein